MDARDIGHGCVTIWQPRVHGLVTLLGSIRNHAPSLARRRASLARIRAPHSWQEAAEECDRRGGTENQHWRNGRSTRG